MKAITCQQPYAYFISHGNCRALNRIKTTIYRGPIAIHAAASAQWFPRTPPHHGWEATHGCAWPDRLDVPYGCIVAIAELVGCIQVRKNTIVPEEFDSLWVGGPACWLLRNVKALSVPVPCKGRPGMFDLDPTVVNAIADQRVNWPLAGRHENLVGAGGKSC